MEVFLLEVVDFLASEGKRKEYEENKRNHEFIVADKTLTVSEGDSDEREG